MAGGVNKTGRNKRNEKYTGLYLSTVNTEAWRAMSPKAHSVYFILKLEWSGPKHNNNGKIRLSVRQAAYKCGISINTAAKAFRELQAKGFIMVTQMGSLGVEGEARSPTYDLTEIQLPPGQPNAGRHLFLKWKEGQDFPVTKHAVNNPTGKGGKPRSRHSFATNRSQEM